MLKKAEAFKLCQHKLFGRLMQLQDQYKIPDDVLHDAFIDSFMYAYKKLRIHKKAKVFTLLWHKLEFRIQELKDVENRQSIAYLTNDDDLPCNACNIAETCKRDPKKCKRLKEHHHDIRGRNYVLSLITDQRQLCPMLVHDELREVQRILQLIAFNKPRFSPAALELLKTIEAPINDDKLITVVTTNLKKQLRFSRSSAYGHLKKLIVEIKNLMEMEKSYELCQY